MRHGARPLVLLCVLVLFTLGFAATTWAAPTVLQALISGNQQYIQNIRTVFDAFEKKNPDLQIKIIETDDVGPKFRVMYAAGTPPDLLRMRGTEPAEFGMEGMIEDLTHRIEGEPSIDLDNFFSPAVPSLGWGGRIYSLPLGVTIQAMLYNKTLFDNAGAPYPDASWDWEREVLEYGKRMSVDANNDGTYDRYFLGNVGTLEWFPFTYAAGGEIFSDDGTRFLANTPAGVTGLQFAGDLMNVHHVTPSRGERGNYDFAAGNLAYNITGSWYVGALRNLDVSFDWDAATVPTFRDHRATNLWPETPWGIPSTATHRDEAWRVLKFIVSREGQELIAQIGLATPIRLDVARSPAYADQSPPDNISAFIDAAIAKETHALPAIPGWSKVYRILRDGAIYPVYDGQKPAQQALDQVESQINNVLKEIHQEK